MAVHDGDPRAGGRAGDLSYPYVAGPVDLAGMVTPDRFAPGTAAGEALNFVSQWA